MFRDASIKPGHSWANEITAAIEEAMTRGFVLVLLSKRAIESPYLAHEIQYALDKAASSDRSAIIPVIVDDAQFVYTSLPPGLPTGSGAI